MPKKTTKKKPQDPTMLVGKHKTYMHVHQLTLSLHVLCLQAQGATDLECNVQSSSCHALSPYHYH